jgi:hypothetical protein
MNRIGIFELHIQPGHELVPARVPRRHQTRETGVGVSPLEIGRACASLSAVSFSQENDTNKVRSTLVEQPSRSGMLIHERGRGLRCPCRVGNQEAA